MNLLLENGKAVETEMELSERNSKASRREGIVYVKGKIRGKQHAAHPDGVTFLDVTSAQPLKSENRGFSPMGREPFEGAFNLEAGWQRLKKHPGIPLETSQKWWAKIETPKRRYPGSRQVEYAQLDDGRQLGYIESRKQWYVPKYQKFMAEKPIAAKWAQRVRGGEDVVVCDFDGPKLPDGTPTCLEVTADMLREKLNDPRHPFGHGYVVAAHLAGIPLEHYV